MFAALTFGFFVYTTEMKTSKSLALPGLCLTAGEAFLAFRNREWKMIAWTTATNLPFLLWTGFVFLSTPRDGMP